MAAQPSTRRSALTGHAGPGQLRSAGHLPDWRHEITLERSYEPHSSRIDPDWIVGMRGAGLRRRYREPGHADQPSNAQGMHREAENGRRHHVGSPDEANLQGSVET